MTRYHPAPIMRLRRSILALGAFFALGGGIAACGSGVPGNAVVDVAGNPITTQAFDHWMYVAAKGNVAQGGGSGPVIVPTDPPSFTGCIAQARRQVPQVRKESASQIRGQCASLFTALSSQVLDTLIRGYWYQADARKEGVKVTDAQVQQQFNSEKNAQFPTQAQFQTFLAQYGYTIQDLLYRTRLQLVYNRLIAKHTKSVTNTDIANYYATHKSQFGTPETRNLRIVLTKTKSQAQAALSALNSGQSWTAVAKKYSIDPATKNKGGVLDNVTQGQTDRSLEKAAFSAKLNTLVGPVAGQFGYYVVEVTKVTTGTQKSLAQSTSLIRQTLLAQTQSNAQYAVDNQAKRDWRSQTKCRSGFAMIDCSGYKAPKTTSTTTPGG
jgi:foldase protein PrsA